MLSIPTGKKEKYNIAIYSRNNFEFNLLLVSEKEKSLETALKKRTY